MTDAGREESERIDRGGDRQIEDKLGCLDEDMVGQLCRAMEFIEETLSNLERKEESKMKDDITIRTSVPGDPSLICYSNISFTKDNIISTVYMRRKC